MEVFFYDGLPPRREIFRAQRWDRGDFSVMKTSLQLRSLFAASLAGLGSFAHAQTGATTTTVITERAAPSVPIGTTAASTGSTAGSTSGMGVSTDASTGSAAGTLNGSSVGDTTVNAQSGGSETGVGVVTDRARSSSTVTTTTMGTSSAVGILVRGGKAFILRGGRMEPVTQPMSLTVSPNGAITGFDGQTVSLPEGQMLTMDGRLTALPNRSGTPLIPTVDGRATTATGAAQANAEMSDANSQAVPNDRFNPLGTDTTGGRPTVPSDGGSSHAGNGVPASPEMTPAMAR